LSFSLSKIRQRTAFFNSFFDDSAFLMCLFRFFLVVIRVVVLVLEFLSTIHSMAQKSLDFHEDASAWIRTCPFYALKSLRLLSHPTKDRSRLRAVFVNSLSSIKGQLSMVCYPNWYQHIVSSLNVSNATKQRQTRS
jgi:hypothetical protein